MNNADVLFAAHGITRIERVITDGSCYRASDFTSSRGEGRGPIFGSNAQENMPSAGTSIARRTCLWTPRPEILSSIESPSAR